jgi:hypothetical protein
MTLERLTINVNMAPRFVPESPAIAVASVESLFVSLPVEFSGRSKNAISCLAMVRRDSCRTRRT